MKAPLALLTKEQLSLLLKRKRQARWAAKWRAANPQLHAERICVARRKFRDAEYNRRENLKRREYFRQYNATRRANRITEGCL